MHDVMTGFFVPNSIDVQNNIDSSFGTTTNIINGGHECGHTSVKAQNRKQIMQRLFASLVLLVEIRIWFTKHLWIWV